MSEHMFGLGPGWLPKRADKIAAAHDATLVNYTDAQCNCGHGCAPYTCKHSRRHWFACANLGDPHNQNRANAVMADLREDGLVK
jgi:hypothetical protein